MINLLARREIIQKLRALGFDGPYSGGNHEYVVKGSLKVRVPNPHSGQSVSVGLIKKIIKQAGTTPEDWEKTCLRSAQAKTPAVSRANSLVIRVAKDLFYRPT